MEADSPIGRGESFRIGRTRKSGRPLWPATRKIGSQVTILGHATYRSGKRVYIQGIDQYTRVADDLGKRSARRRNDRCSELHRLHNRNAEPLVDRWKSEAAGTLHQCDQMAARQVAQLSHRRLARASMAAPDRFDEF